MSVDRTVNQFSRTARGVERAVDNVGGALGSILGFGGTVQQEESQRKARGYSAEFQQQRSHQRLVDFTASNDDYRAPYLNGNGGKGPRGFSGGQRREDGQSQGQDPRYAATEQYVLKMVLASQEEPGSPERAARMKEAEAVLTNPRNGLMPDGPEGGVFFPTMTVSLGDGQPVNFAGASAVASSPEITIKKGMDLIAGYGIGKAPTAADIAALRGTAAPAGATIPVGTGEQPKPDAPQAPAPAPAPGAGTGAGGTSPADKSAAPRVLAEPKNGMPQMKMTKDEVIDLQTKLMNTPGFEQEAKAMAARGGADGKPGSATYAAFSKLGSLMNPPLRAEEIDMSNPEIVAKVNAVIEAKRGKSPSVDGQSAPAPAPAADAGQATAPTATDATRLAEAVKMLEATAGAGADRELSAGNMAALQQTPELMKTVGQAFDLNKNGRVEEAELSQIVAAAAAKPEAERVTVVGGVAALNPLFAGASFAPVQPATDVATVDSPAPGQAQTAQVNPQTGEVKPPAAAPASAPLGTENAVYVVPPEPAFEPPPPSVPDVRAPGQRSGGFTIP